MGKRIAIIGAGASGLIGIKCCLEEGLEPVCLERSGAIGGLWRYEEKVSDGQSCVMKTTVINTSKEMMAFSDFPIPAEFPNYMHNTKVMEYFEMYAKKFEMYKYITFHQEIMSVTQTNDYATTGQWNLKIKDLKTEKVRDEVFDGVLVCTGHHADKNLPEFPGQNEFEGNIVHTHDYRDHKGYEDKRVVVVGIGNSGGDVAVELSKISSQVHLCTRSGSWILNRIGETGMPADLQFSTRVSNALLNVLPQSFTNALAEKKIEGRMNHAKYGLRPNHRFNAQHPMVNDELPNRIICGSIIVKPNIKRFTKNGLEFEDGTVAENVDTVIMATGFIFGFPFLDKSIINVVNNRVELFKYCFPPELSPATLAVIGFIQPWGAINPIAELQCRWAVRVFKGATPLPPKSAMWADIRAKQDAMTQRYVESSRHTIQVDWIPFMDEVAEQAGCKPDLWRLFKADPRLGLSCFFGPCTPYQYRLQGPGRWAGARDAILTTWDRVNKPLATRPVHVEEPNPLFKFLLLGLLLLVLYYWLF